MRKKLVLLFFVMISLLSSTVFSYEILSLNKTAFTPDGCFDGLCSGRGTDYDPLNINDGNTTNNPDFMWIPFNGNTNGNNITIDLNNTYPVSNITVLAVPDGGATDREPTFSVAYSFDNLSYTTLYSNINLTGMGTTIWKVDDVNNFTRFNARYIRLFDISGEGNEPRLSEVAVYGESALNPTASTRISPVNPIVTSNLDGYATGTYINASYNVSFDYSWYINGVVNRSNNSINYTSGTEVLLDTLSYTYTSLNDNITFSARSYNGTNYSSWANYTVTILEFFIDNCSVNNNTVANFTFLNTSQLLTTTHNINILFGPDSTSKEYNYSVSNTGTDFAVCIYPIDTNLTADILIDYQYNGIYYEFNTINTILNSNLKTFNNYISEGTTEVTFSVIDSNDFPLENHLIKIMEFDVGTNTYLTHEVLKTNSDGEAVGNIVLGQNFYRFIISDDTGEVVLTEPTTQGLKVYTTSYPAFRVGDTEDVWFTSFTDVLGLSTTLQYNNVTDTFSFSWDTQDGSSVEGCLRVDRFDFTTSETLYDSCSITTAGTLVYTISEQNGSRYAAQGYFKFNPEFVTDTLGFIVDHVFSFVDKNKPEANYVGFLVVIGLVLIGIPFPLVSLTLMGFGLITMSILQIFVIDTALLVALIIIGLIHAYRGFK